MNTSLKGLFTFFSITAFSISCVAQFTLSDRNFLHTSNGLKAYCIFNNSLDQVNSAGTVDWEMPLQFHPFAISKTGNDIGVIYVKDDNVHYAIIKTGNKTIESDRIIFQQPHNLLVVINLLNTPSGNLVGILFRTTALNYRVGGFAEDAAVKRGTTTDMNLVILNTGSEPKITNIKSNALQAVFLSAIAGNDGDFYIVSHSDKDVVAERFNVAGEQTDKLALDVKINTSRPTHATVNYDSTTHNCIDVGFVYVDNVKDVYAPVVRFDFDKKKVLESDPVELGKDYYNTLKTQNPHEKLKHLKGITGLEPLLIVHTKDKIIFLKEIANFSINSNFRMGDVISIYTKDLKLVREIPIDKSAPTSSLMFPCTNARLMGDTLYTVTSESDGLNFYGELYKINIDDGSKKTIDINKQKFSGLFNVFAIIWLNKSFIVPIVEEKRGFSNKVKIQLLSQQY